MHVLVVATPRHPIPPADLPGVVEGALDWHERHKDELEAFGTFPGGGGFGVVDVADGEHLNQLMLEMPFSFFSHHELYPFAPGDTGLRQLREMLAARAAG
jgi:hypothetical protein